MRRKKGEGSPLKGRTGSICAEEKRSSKPSRGRKSQSGGDEREVSKTKSRRSKVHERLAEEEEKKRSRTKRKRGTCISLEAKWVRLVSLYGQEVRAFLMNRTRLRVIWNE